MVNLLIDLAATLYQFLFLPVILMILLYLAVPFLQPQAVIVFLFGYLLHGVYLLINNKVNNSTGGFWILPCDFPASRGLICCLYNVILNISSAVYSNEL